jgi:hypothetical protein
MVNIKIKSKEEKDKKFFNYNLFIKDCRGWEKLVEVFIAILLLTGVLFVVVNKLNSSDKNTLSAEMSQKELAILRDIELNNTLRTEVLSATPPLEWDNFGPELQDVKNRIISLTPSNLECEAKICLINADCTKSTTSEKSVYAKSVIISADLNTYSPRELKLFCVEK